MWIVSYVVLGNYLRLICGYLYMYVLIIVNNVKLNWGCIYLLFVYYILYFGVLFWVGSEVCIKLYIYYV